MATKGSKGTGAVRPGAMTPGMVLAIPLSRGGFGFAQNVNGVETVFFRRRADELISPEEIAGEVIPFRCMVTHQALRSWRQIGVAPVADALSAPGVYYRRDAMKPDEYFLCTAGTAAERPATREACLGLECYAVWSKVHIEDRLNAEHHGERSRFDLRLK